MGTSKIFIFQSGKRRVRGERGEQDVAGEASGNTEADGGGRPPRGQVRVQVLVPTLVQYIRQVRHLVSRSAVLACEFRA